MWICISVQLNLPSDKQFKLSGKGLGGTYSALQLHFHWVAKKSTTGGSEHTINGNHYEAEVIAFRYFVTYCLPLV